MKLDRIIAVRTGKTIYRDGDRVIKVFDSDYSKADILNEALNQARIEETGLAIPKVLEVTMVDGKWAIVTEYIEGKTMAELVKENPGKFDEYLDRFVDLQLLVHSKKAPLLTKLKDKMNRKITQTDLDATTRYELHTRLESMPKHDKVCHGDFNMSNIIVTKDGKLYILDWAHAAIGNASADAAMTYLQFALEDQKKADLYLKLFCKKNDIAMQYVQRWLPIVAAAQMTKKHGAEKAFLTHWTQVVEFE